MKALLYLIIAYLVGSIPTGYLIARWCGVQDIRKHGSGNIGATNVARMLGHNYFFIVLFIDALKAFLCITCGYSIVTEESYVHFLSTFLLLGNGHSLFLHFTGGKGVGTAVGMLTAFSFSLLLSFIGIWLAIFLLTHIAGLASIVALVLLPCIGYYSAYNTFIIQLFIALWCLYRHRDNIKKLVKK
ncbi:glycerol-3-phosphate 1-O-acyltransferase PlsY [Candidatus Dependentiae bacterium]|nr:glycerol-3-phosphate 1-O-acyltransferase PlsY [Candidatus Dependentiae bacterium]